MANHKQAEKRNRQRIRRTSRNRHIRQTMRSHVKRVTTLVEAGDSEGAQTALAQATEQLDKSVTKGILPRKAASRKISRLTIAVRRISG